VYTGGVAAFGSGLVWQRVDDEAVDLHVQSSRHHRELRRRGAARVAAVQAALSSMLSRRERLGVLSLALPNGSSSTMRMLLMRERVRLKRVSNPPGVDLK
jgi:hypothetical protein